MVAQSLNEVVSTYCTFNHPYMKMVHTGFTRKLNYPFAHGTFIFIIPLLAHFDFFNCSLKVNLEVVVFCEVFLLWSRSLKRGYDCCI